MERGEGRKWKGGKGKGGKGKGVKGKGVKGKGVKGESGRRGKMEKGKQAKCGISKVLTFWVIATFCYFYVVILIGFFMSKKICI